MKRIFRLLAVLALVLILAGTGLLPTEARAASSGTCGDNLTWTLDSAGKLTISGTGAMDDYYYGGTNTPWDDVRAEIKSVVVGSDVTVIGSSAFQDCTRLTTVTIQGETAINYCAFSGCTNLYTVTMDKVKTVGQNAFMDDAKLTNLSMPNVQTIDMYAFKNCSRLTKLTINNAVQIKDQAFRNCTALGSVSMNSAQTLGIYAFAQCPNLVTVTMPKVQTIGGNCFDNCIKLTGLTLPDTLITIGTQAFSNCDGLTSVTIPASVTAMGNESFRHCDGLKTLVIEGETEVGNNSFSNCIVLETVKMNKVTTLGNGAFSSCAALTTVEMEDVVSIGTYAFSGASSLKKAVMDKADVIGYDAFKGCTALASVSMDNAGFIGSSAFEGCTSLTSVTIPFTLASDGLGTWAFRDCTGLKTVKIEAICELGQWAFSGCTSLQSVSIPDVTYIHSYAFLDCTSLTVVDMPWVNTIEGYAFQNCTNLTTIGLSNQLATIGYGAFKGCTALTDVYYSASELEWGFVNILEGDNEPLTSAAIHYNSTIPAVQITSNPSTRRIKSGETATFSVKAVGNGLSYQWQVRTSADGSWKNTSATGNKTATLKVNGTTARSGYQYRCRVTDAAGNRVYSKTAKLYVLGIKSSPATAYVKTGDTATFTVKATGASKVYQWQTRTSADGTWKDSTASTANKATLSISAASKRNGYQYRCKVTDSAGNVVYSKAATLYVLAITSNPSTRTADSGDTVKFTVKATGGGLTYQWQVRTSSDGSWTNSSASSAKTRSLSVTAANKRDGYQYRCRVTDAAGNRLYSKVATLNVG